MMIDNMLSTFHALMTDDPNIPLNFREVFKNELFRLSSIQVSPHFGMYHSLWLRTSNKYSVCTTERKSDLFLTFLN
jgi:hypothetical protein